MRIDRLEIVSFTRLEWAREDWEPIARVDGPVHELHRQAAVLSRRPRGND
jgi:hypothetical protein